jgi:hypothetical protein
VLPAEALGAGGGLGPTGPAPGGAVARRARVRALAAALRALSGAARHGKWRPPLPPPPAPTPRRPPFFICLPQVSQKAAEEVVKQGGNKDEANAAAQVAAKAAVDATNAAQKQGVADLATVANKAAAPVVDAYSKDKNAKVGPGLAIALLTVFGLLGTRDG